MIVIKKCSFLGLALILSLSLFGQKDRSFYRGQSPVDQFKAELNLTQEQEQQITALQEKHRQEMQALRNQEFETPEARKEAFGKLRNDQRTGIDKILTQEQKDILNQKRSEMRDGRPQGIDKAQRQAMYDEMKAYREKNIMPVMQGQRAKLEGKLSAEDKATLAELRATMKEKERGVKGKDKPRQSRESIKRGRETHSQEFETLRALTEKYDAEIEALYKEIEPQRNQWQKDLEAIAARHKPERPEDGRPAYGEKGKGKGERINKGRFLLMNPAVQPATTEKGKAEAELNVFPNPAGAANTVRYSAKEDGNVRIELRSKEGNLLRVLLDEFRTAGDYTIEVDISNLNDGVYFYTITDKYGTTSRKVVVAKN
jgi:hypothetical protein